MNMNRTIKLALSASMLVAVAGTAFGQADKYNIDFNKTSGNGAGVPANTYGGAANQPGFWNSITSASAGTTQLKNLDGSNSFVTLTRDVTQPFLDANDGAYTGEAATLMEDYQGASGVAQMQYTLNDMPSGLYAVYVYAKRPGSTQTCTVTVTGKLQPGAVGRRRGRRPLQRHGPGRGLLDPCDRSQQQRPDPDQDQQRRGRLGHLRRHPDQENHERLQRDALLR
jgi:hypothetical protein